MWKHLRNWSSCILSKVGNIWEYSMKYFQSHLTLLWIWVMVCSLLTVSTKHTFPTLMYCGRAFWNCKCSKIPWKYRYHILVYSNLLDGIPWKLKWPQPQACCAICSQNSCERYIYRTIFSLFIYYFDTRGQVYCNFKLYQRLLFDLKVLHVKAR